MQQEIAFTKQPILSEAMADIRSQLHNSSYDLILFITSTPYDFSKLTEEFHRIFPDSQVVGVKSCGHFIHQGFSERGLLVTTMTDSDLTLSPIIINSINKYPIIHKSKIEKAIKQCNIDLTEKDFPSHCFAFTFINGLMNFEEEFLSMMYAIIGNPDFQLIGASAGNDDRSIEGKVSLNGTVSSDGAVVVFINTKKRFKVYKHDFYKPTGQQLLVTKSDITTRRVLELDKKPALTAYAEVLGVSSTTLIDTIIDHPLGRSFGSDTYPTSLVDFNADKTLNMHTRIINNSMLEILEPADFLTVCEDTCKKISADFKYPGFVFILTCTTIVKSSMRENYAHPLLAICTKFLGQYCGMATCGEQLNQIHLSHGTLLLVMEE